MLRVFKHLALLALPRTGSTWFANCVFGEERRGDNTWEFFNPSVNPKFYSTFGGNRYWWKLFEPLTEKQNILIYKHWQMSGFDSVKECWGCGKVDFFAEHFDCFAVVRETELTFPGVSTPKINDFAYRAYYGSLLYHKWSLKPYRKSINFLFDHANSFYEKVCGAHIISTQILKDVCAERNIPVFDYRMLVTLDESDLYEYLKPLPIFNSRIVDRIIKTRNPRLSTEKFDNLNVTEFCKDLRATS